MPILTPKDRAFLADQGYLRIPGVIPPENCRAAAAALYEFLEIDPAQPDTWYQSPWCKGKTGGFIEIYHHQALWDNRQNPRLYQIFAEHWGQRELHVSLDRASFKPPERPDVPDSIGEALLHLDVDLLKARDALGKRFLQGVIYLTDTAADQGGFHCVPGFHRRLRDWLAASPEPPTTQPPDFKKITPTPIPGATGDLVVWDHFLPHGGGRNLSKVPRLAQYVFLMPATPLSETERADRVRRWQECLPTFGGDPRQLEQKRGKPATLTPLGRKLLGVDPW